MGVDVMLFHGTTEEPLRRLSEIGQVTVAVGENGFETAEITMPHSYAHDLGSEHVWLGGNIGPFCQIDARDEVEGLVATGRCAVPNVNDRRTEVSMQVNGPRSWLDRATVGGGRKTAVGMAGQFVELIIHDHPARLRLEAGHISRGEPTVLNLNANSVSSFLKRLAKQTGEEPFLTAIPGRVAYRIDWRLPRTDSRIMYDQVALIEDRNCKINPAYNLDWATDEMALVGHSLYHAFGTNTTTHKAPEGLVLGREAALSAVVTSSAAWGLGGGKAGGVRPDLPHGDALYAEAEAELRDKMTVPIDVVIELTRFDLIDKLRVGDLVNVQYWSDFVNAFRHGIGRVTDISYQLHPSLQVKLKAKLWRRLYA